MSFHVLIPKETKAEERRVAMIPKDVQALVKQGHQVFVEHNAGTAAGFSDEDYQRVGAEIRFLSEESLDAYKKFFLDINVIARAKRPDRKREILESQAIMPNTIMIGALDPLEQNSSHIQEYHQAKIIAYSIDQLKLPPEDPMNILAAMSKIAGKLALLDAIQKYKGIAKSAVIIGYGTVGRSAFNEAIKKNLSVTIILTNPMQAKEIAEQGGKAVLLNKQDSLQQQQKVVFDTVQDAKVVIAGARVPDQRAPLLLPLTTLQHMKQGAVVVDMALSEGGNVEGSEHDATHILGNQILVTNISGYPKAMPHEASILWSQASLQFILRLAEKKPIPLRAC
jgi:NAD/NADP transhydrogenase alpha subunit